MTREISFTSRCTSFSAPVLRSLSTVLLLATAGLFTGPLQGQKSLSPRGIPTSAYISARVQADIDEDVLRWHIGDVVQDPGPRAKLSASLRPGAVHAAMRKVGDWELKRAEPWFDNMWTWGVLDTGYMAAAQELNEPRYRDAMLAMAEKLHWAVIPDEATIDDASTDDQTIGQTYLELYLQQPSPEKIAAIQAALDKLMAGAWMPVPADQAQIAWWQADALYMAPPAWARMAAASHDSRYLGYLDQHWWQTHETLYDPHYHLYYRDVTFMNQKSPAGKPVFWSRGNGWVIAGLARVLEYLPKDFPTRAKYENQMREMAVSLTAIQDRKNGLWHADLLDPADYPQPEVSGSGLIVFGLAWGVNHGVLDRATYTPVIAKAWRGMIGEIYADGRLGNIQQTDGQPNRYLPGSSFNFGVGAFLLAGSEVARLSDSAGSINTEQSGGPAGSAANRKQGAGN